jgi:hypothetical protein
VIASILESVAASARVPADFLSATMTWVYHFSVLFINNPWLQSSKRRSKRFTEIGRSGSVSKKVSARCFAVSAKKWSVGAKTFLQTCAEAGNLNAAYTLGMVYLVFANTSTMFSSHMLLEQWIDYQYLF